MLCRKKWYQFLTPYVMYFCGILANLWVPGKVGKQLLYILAIQPSLLIICMSPGAFCSKEKTVLNIKESVQVASKTMFIYIVNIMLAMAYLNQLLTFTVCLWLSIFCGILVLLVNYKKFSHFSKKRSAKVWLYLATVLIVIYPLGINYYPLATSLFSDGFLAYSFLLSSPTVVQRTEGGGYA